ncbi:hypothetical protein DK925_24240, partial [Enterobacter cloacae]
FGLAENTDDLFVGKTLLHGDVLMWLMKTLLTSRCINQRGAGHTNTPPRIESTANALVPVNVRLMLASVIAISSFLNELLY